MRIGIKGTWFAALILVFAVFIFTFNPKTAFAENSNNGTVSEQYLANKHFQHLKQVYEVLKNYYVDEVDPEVLYKGAMEGMLNSLDDPYTSYIVTDSVVGQDLKDTTEGSFGGIGVTITKPVQNTKEKPAYVEVTSPIDGTPGARAGLKSGDYIIEIEGQPTADITMSEVLSILRGRVGDPVTIKILRGKALKFDLTIVREKIEVPTVKHAMLDNHIGYIKLIEFNPNSYPRILDAYHDLKAKGCKKLIFDLRNNGGGLLTSGIDVASIFLKSGVVVSTKSRVPGGSRSFNVNRFSEKLPEDLPVVVLINGGSASASEIVAGALKDHKRAYLVGTKTFGKGLVQNIFDLDQKEGFKVTTARYYSPSDANIDKIGIPADYTVDVPQVLEEEEDAVVELYKSEKLDTFAKSKQKITTQEIHNYAKKLSSEYDIRLEILDILVKTAVDRYHDSDIVSAEFDPQLKAAVDLLNTKDVNALSKQTKTVFELQSEIKAKDKE